MLKEINSDVFRQKKIIFKDGLNVVLGDSNGSNSIGKSTFLLIIDFILGGNTYISEKKDAIHELGDHEFRYSFSFNKKNYYFARTTNDHKDVYECDGEYNKIGKISLSDYNNKLKKLYGINNPTLSFREFVSLFSRVWGKHNDEVKRPLHNAANEKNEVAVEKLIKYFNQDQDITETSKQLKAYIKTKDAIKVIGNSEIIPIITKRKYDQNIIDIKKIDLEIEVLSNDYLSAIIEAKDIMSKELLALQDRRDIACLQKQKYEYKLKRINNNILKNKRVNTSKFNGLLEIFPDVNLEKLVEIDSFHKGISNILESELKETQSNLSKLLKEVKIELDEIDCEIEQHLDSKNIPEKVMKTLLDLNIKKTAFELENKYYNEKLHYADIVAKKKDELITTKENVLKNIQTTLNSVMAEISDYIYNGIKRAPYLSLDSKNYVFELFENTGTGKAYTNIIIFDLSIFKLTNLPMLIHDTILFKHIEIDTIDGIMRLYEKSPKQIFISIDEKEKYNPKTQSILDNNKVLSLSKEEVLFVKNWGNKK